MPILKYTKRNWIIEYIQIWHYEFLIMHKIMDHKSVDTKMTIMDYSLFKHSTSLNAKLINIMKMLNNVVDHFKKMKHLLFLILYKHIIPSVVIIIYNLPFLVQLGYQTKAYNLSKNHKHKTINLVHVYTYLPII